MNEKEVPQLVTSSIVAAVISHIFLNIMYPIKVFSSLFAHYFTPIFAKMGKSKSKKFKRPVVLSAENFQLATSRIRDFNHAAIYLAPAVLQHLIDKNIIDIHECYPRENKYGPYEGQDLQWMFRSLQSAGLVPVDVCAVAIRARNTVAHNNHSQMFAEYQQLRQSWLDCADFIGRVDIKDRIVKILPEFSG